LARLAGIRAQIGYKRRPGKYGGKPSVVVDNTLNRQFDVDAPDQFWVTDITYIKTHEGFSYLAVVIDLYSRRVVALSWFACKPLSGNGWPFGVESLPTKSWSIPPLVHCCAIPCRAADYIEMFYNPKRKHARNGMLSPVEFERQQKWKQQGV